ncbi:winged helix-turn-helix domain-containing protein [Dokdonella koreensis]|uniref:Transcriptional regulator domain protein n=1 Tax=Dokdonella koreensis DS-123 TaxID=1300342 RepID=A0A160DW50_9GAMM|nr:winged helix-turn-helix domain-containing protein [Dokdonella koreensis]ANB18817.1 Transcriptional regulator domain protein [Dokdonella koreensis DS-123]
MQTSVYRFGRFALDAKGRELREDGVLLAIPPKSFDCVAYLVEHRDRAVGRDELISAVWGVADVNDHTLGQTLLRARQALGDVEAERSMIRTVPRFGYRWIAVVEVIEYEAAAPAAPPAAERPVATAPPVEPVEPVEPLPPAAADGARPVRRWPWTRIALGLVVVLAGVGLGLWLARPPAPRNPATAPPASGALFMVLPVQLDGSQAATTWVRLGVMDYIATLLRQDGGQPVLPSDQVVSLVGDEPIQGREGENLGRLRAATGATHIVLPRAEQSDGRWHLSLDVFHDGTLDTYASSAAAPLEAAAQAIAQLMAHLRLHATVRVAPLPDDERLTRIDAALLMGDLEEAKRLIERGGAAAGTDPRFSVRAGNVAVRQGRLADAERLYRPLAEDLAQPDATLRARAWMGLGAVQLLQADNAAAVQSYTQAITLLGDGREGGWLGRSYMGRGASQVALEHYDEATADFSRARVELDRAGDRIGQANLDINVGMADAYRGRYTEALAAQDRAIAILAGFGIRDQLVISLHNKIYTQLALLDVAGAVATGRQAMEQIEHLANPAINRRVAAAFTRSLLAAGLLREAGEVIERFDDRPDDPAASDTEFAALRAVLLTEQGHGDRLVERADAIVARISRSADLSGQTSMGEVCWLVVQAAAAQGRIAPVERMLHQLESASSAPQDIDRAIILDLIRAERTRLRGEGDGSALYAEALAKAEARGAPESIIVVAVAWLRPLLADGDLERAAAVGGRLAAYADRDYRAARATEALYRALGRPSLAQAAAGKAAALAGERDLTDRF